MIMVMGDGTKQMEERRWRMGAIETVDAQKGTWVDA
jgi:hypothetical protein